LKAFYARHGDRIREGHGKKDAMRKWGIKYISRALRKGGRRKWVKTSTGKKWVRKAWIEGKTRRWGGIHWEG